MKKNIGLVLGFLVLLFCLGLTKNLREAKNAALKLDSENKGYGIIMGPQPCEWTATVPERVMGEDKTQAVLITTNNTTDTACESLIYLRAPNFDMSPNKEEQKIALSASSSGSLSWIITPRKTGSFELSVTDNINTKIFGITVKNMYGLSGLQAKIVSVLGTIFGPMLTLPWWWDRLKKKT